MNLYEIKTFFKSILFNGLTYSTLNKHKKLMLNAFPAEIHDDVKVVVGILNLKNRDIISETKVRLSLKEEYLSVPVRLYFEEPDVQLEETLTPIQKDILNCIFLRHHNGFIREKRLRKLSLNTKFWMIPFLFLLSGEYVFEILIVLNERINKQEQFLYSKFIEENPLVYQRTKSRMISYWNAYYRNKHPRLREYVGVLLLSKMKNSLKNPTS